MFINAIAAIQVLDILVTQSASEPLNGMFTIAFMGHVTSMLSHDATSAEVR